MSDPRVNYGNDTPISRRYGGLTFSMPGYMIEEFICVLVDLYGKEKVTPEFIEELRKSLLKCKHEGGSWHYFQATNT